MVNQEGNGTIKQYYLILLCAIIAFMLAFGFIITTWVETMQRKATNSKCRFLSNR